jgi:hypothetical protein
MSRTQAVLESLNHLQSGGGYQRLVLIVGFPGTGKTRILREAAKAAGFPVLNVNLELSRHLLPFSRNERTRIAGNLFSQALSQHPVSVIGLDNLELLFSPELAVDPLRLLQQESRSRCLVTTWSGAVIGQELHYAVPGHPEHVVHPLPSTPIVQTAPAVSLENP